MPAHFPQTRQAVRAVRRALLGLREFGLSVTGGRRRIQGCKGCYQPSYRRAPAPTPERYMDRRNFLRLMAPWLVVMAILWVVACSGETRTTSSASESVVTPVVESVETASPRPAIGETGEKATAKTITSEKEGLPSKRPDGEIKQDSAKTEAQLKGHSVETSGVETSGSKDTGGRDDAEIILDEAGRESDLEASPGATTTAIAFQSDRYGNADIFLMRPDGTGQTRLTDDPSHDANPSLSPDGTKIVFSTYRDGPYSEIYVMNVDGTGQTGLTNNPSSHDYDPSWSPDGSRIVFKSDRDGIEGSYEIYVMNFDGTGQTRLTNYGVYSWGPSWSPDGTKIVFSTKRDGPYSEIYVMNADGTGQTGLTNNPSSHDSLPSWSPDGTRIVFETDRDGNREIYVMNADGSGQTRLTNHPDDDIQASWSPDGSKIAFQSNRDGNYEIYVLNADGTGVVRQTSNSAQDGAPSWSQYPDPVPTPKS